MDARTETASVETARSWLIATAVLVILMFGYGTPMLVNIALKDIAADLGTPRATPAFVGALAWLGLGAGAIAFGRIADRIGYRWTTAGGAVAIGLGLALSQAGGVWHLMVGHALLLGLLGCGAINVPLMVYVSRWFDRRRGSALAYVTNGQYLAGALWPLVVSWGIEHFGWRTTMLGFGVITTLVVVPLALFALAPEPQATGVAAAPKPGRDPASYGLSEGAAFWLLTVAGVLCCIPMAMPSAHLIALCSDLGLTATRGALMLSVLLGSAIFSRQLWGWLSDRIGGLNTILIGSIAQAAALCGLAFVEGETGLFLVSAAFGLGYSGIIPAYVLTLREMFRADEAVWRVPVWFFINVWGMAMGGWIAGLIYDATLSYRTAFLVGVVCNIANVAMIGWMVSRPRRPTPEAVAA